jgi:hypothetical protein
MNNSCLVMLISSIRNVKILLLIVPCIFIGCSLLLKNNYGYNDPVKFTENEYEIFLNSIDTSQIIHMRSDVSQFKEVINLCKDSVRRKDLNQPIQLLYFEDTILVSYHANCYAKGSLSGIDWNYNNRFNKFPPESAIECSLFDLKISNFRDIYSEIYTEKKYTVIIFWSWMLEGVSRDAIVTVQKNIRENEIENDTSIFLVNIDEFWRYTFQSKEQ